MAFQVSRTDTGQFVLIDPATDTVVIDDDLAVGFAKVERIVADKPPKPTASSRETTAPVGAGTEGSAAFSFVGGPRYVPVLLAVVLPFAWLAVLYLALANLLSEHALDRSSGRETQAKIDELEREVQSLRSEIAGAPRTAKQTPKPLPKQLPTAKPAPNRAATDKAEPGNEPPADEDAGAEPGTADDDGAEEQAEGPR